MPSLNLRLEHWQLEDLRVRARNDGRSIQRFVENALFPPGDRPLPLPATVTDRPPSIEKLVGETVPLVAVPVTSRVMEPIPSVAGPRRARRVRCEHRIPAGSYCRICDQ